MRIVKTGDETRIAETAEYLHRAMQPYFKRSNLDSPLRKLVSDSPHYAALTNNEDILAMSRALALIQIDLNREMAALTYDDWFADDEEAA